MSNDNTALYLVAGVGLYLYLKRNQAQGYQQAPQGYQGGVPSMPGNVGTGTAQMAGGALAGFLSSMIGGGFGGNSASGILTQAPRPYETGAVQDSVGNDVYLQQWAEETGW